MFNMTFSGPAADVRTKIAQATKKAVQEGLDVSVGISARDALLGAIHGAKPDAPVSVAFSFSVKIEEPPAAKDQLSPKAAAAAESKKE